MNALRCIWYLPLLSLSWHQFIILKLATWPRVVQTSDWGRNMIFVIMTVERWWCCNGVKNIFLMYITALDSKWASFKCYSTPEYCCWPHESLYGHVFLASNGNLQQDNAPCYKAHVMSSWLYERENEFGVFQWLPVTRS